MSASVADVVADLSPAEQRRLLRGVNADELIYDWGFWGRPEQQEPVGDWSVWLVLAGRGFGKTRCGAEWVNKLAKEQKGIRIALVARTAADARDTMVKGESGILTISPDWFRPKYEPSKRLLTWPNGSIATIYTADEPDLLRGPQHHAAWCDELATWRRLEAWDNLEMGLRLGANPRTIITTTPRPKQIIRDIMKDAATHLTTGSMFDNSGNLPEKFIKRMENKYEGTRLGRQELYAEVLDDVIGAMWTHNSIEELRLPELLDDQHAPEGVEIVRQMVSIDPAVTSDDNSNETGIVAGFSGYIEGDDRLHAFITHDISSVCAPNQWARKACNLYHALQADRIVAEVNNGGDLVETVIKNISGDAAYMAVRATKDKKRRAEPIAALYEQGRVHHLGVFPQLEDQMCLFNPHTYEGSPDRLDAMVWLVTGLILDAPEVPMIRYL